MKTTHQFVFLGFREKFRKINIELTSIVRQKLKRISWVYTKKKIAFILIHWKLVNHWIDNTVIFKLIQIANIQNYVQNYRIVIKFISDIDLYCFIFQIMTLGKVFRNSLPSICFIIKIVWSIIFDRNILFTGRTNVLRKP